MASRRRFLQSAAALSAASQTTPAQTPFTPSGAPVKLSDNLFVFEDTCNVYIVRDGPRAVLIDFGSGKVLDHLAALGIREVEWILHTHHHRDQCQGDKRAVERGIKIAVPAHEAHLFADAENFWRNRRVFHLYYVRNDFQTLTENVPVAQRLTDYSTFRWRNIDFFVLPTPGHTLGSITLLASIDGKRAAFSGDLMCQPGKILNLYDTQVNYGGAEGINFGHFSLARLREQRPALLCPSHGDPLRDPDEAIVATMRNLDAYFRFQNGGEPMEFYRPQVISPHLIAHHLTESSFYTIVSASGKAMFIDYGSASHMTFNVMMNATPVGDRIRFLEHTIPMLKREYGVKSVDVAMPSHIHDDHMNGFPHLKRHHATKVWCLDNMVDIFENPRGQNLGCILGEAFQVDRAFKHGQRFQWEEFDFEITHSPGHTEYQMALFVTIDGNRVAFTGDAFFPPNQGKTALRHNLIFRNDVTSESHLRSIRNLVEHEPNLIAPGHGRPYPVDRSLLEVTETALRRQRDLFHELLPEGEVDFGLNPSWVRLYPYQMLARAGATQSVEVRVNNLGQSAMKFEASLVAPRDWKISPDVMTLQVPAGRTVRKVFQVSLPSDWKPVSPRFAIALDVRRDGRYLGQITEAVVEVA
ncbi:MAG: MBL fold metallo-hydrolase [Bryobacteraceae bacterium]|nr:MBL fold metallo-hydrolase [Bryobacteraceae bacterium]